MALLSRKFEKSTPLSGRLAALLRESRLLLLVAVAIYLILILYGYDRNDPAWSNSVSDVVPHNSGGMFGAWLADVLLYVFGFSAWWWVAFLLQQIWADYRGISQNSLFDRRTLKVALIGFVVLLLASSSLEALRLYTLKAVLPLAPGGMLGMMLGNGLAYLLGFTGATLFLLVLIVSGFSLFSGLSWLRFTDRLGAMLESFYFWMQHSWLTWQDKRVGAQALNERKIVVEEEKKRVENHLPIYIEQPLIEVRQSARVSEEKQVPLFPDMPDTPLPPLHLLD
ncbi:MAG: DNA translocase FtsK 4TM domain-containing protein, partial [Candidatus Nitrotoga sp.]